MIRTLKVVKDSAMKARTQAINQIKALVVAAPADLRHVLDDLSISILIRRCVGLRPGDVVTPTAAAKLALRSIARRHEQLTAEIGAIDTELVRLTAEAAPGASQSVLRRTRRGGNVPYHRRDNPERLRSESAFAALYGVSPLPASSGKTNRHRLNRGGDRRGQRSPSSHGYRPVPS